jgi:hypothetical protein
VSHVKEFLEEKERAIEDAKRFTDTYGSKKPVQSAQIAFAIGAHYAEKEAWDKAKDKLSHYMPVIDKAAPDVQVQAHAMLARAYAKTKGGQANARAEYAKVRSLWSNPTDAVAKIKAAYAGDDERQNVKRLGKALTAVGEAYFFAAEEAREEKVDSLKFPVYKGSGKKEDVLNHIKTKVAEWYKKKSEAIRAVEPEYVKVLDLQPEPPPKLQQAPPPAPL